MIDENTLLGTGRGIRSTAGGITLQNEKKEESAGNHSAYIHLIMDAQLDIQNGEFVSALYLENADDARTPYSIVYGFDWGWKDTPSLGLARACIL